MSCVILMFPDTGEVSLGNLGQRGFSVQLNHLHLDDVIKQFSAITGHDTKLIHVNDFIELSPYQEVSWHNYVAYYINWRNFLQIKYGILVACFKGADGHPACLIRGLENMRSPLGEPILDESDCPLLCLTRTIFTTLTKNIRRAVSIVHQCTSSCQFVVKGWPRALERETVCSSRMEYEHDFTNNFMYSLNIYCMNT